ncbi:YggS family pyridoxal phosphate-dependent enzyme [Mariniphaga sediminis]|uniref:Pyridoxal phosphate homeostasis protein n=1 Tax=Mariniphaga sediminis TaxID=1628158 RepID=A0A399D314_9BACT|nr:YggS family pyridoxal phosphate-dependent enzyme [Mariniphaga sediminis]RIH65866.1 YggS family pyridoxal phosphate-dependent enzyme [Mariniphaga sediminis]
MDIGENISEIKKTLPAGVKLVAVSKTKPIEVIQDAYQTGHKIFGENKAQELTQKHEVLPKDIEWHFIGHLQSNKTKYIAPFVNMIHGIDSFKILKAVNKEARKNNRVIPCLLQFHIAQESTKFGFSEEEAREMLESETFATMKNITIAGVMGMATFTDDEQQVRNEFKSLKSIFEKLKNNYFPNEPQFKEISMGMSDDYSVAVEEGSTIVRIGSIIFGARQIKTT